jgi:hypothetical protein
MSTRADGKPGPPRMAVQFNDRGAFGGDAGLTYDKTTNHLVLDSLLLNDAVIHFTYATGTLTLGAQPTAGDTITVGGLAYTYVDGVASEGQITIGATLAETQADTVSAINVGIGLTFPYAGALPFSANVSPIVAAVVGTAGNGVVTTSAFVDSSNHFGQLALAGGTDGTSTDHIQAESAELTGASAATPVLRIVAAPGTDAFASASILEIVDSDGSPIAAFDSGGNFYTFRDLRLVDPAHSATFRVGADKVIYARIADSNASYQVFIDGDPNDTLIFSLRPSAGTTARVASAGAGSVALEVDTAGVDSTDLIQAYGNVNFDLVFRLMQSGAVVIAQHSAPDDGALSAGDMALWFDQTDGAAKLKIKGKSANGTVVSGEVALA